MDLIDDLSLTVAKYQEELDDDIQKITMLESFLNDNSKSAELSENELVMVEQKLAGATANYVSRGISITSFPSQTNMEYFHRRRC